ncbi:hypothetical protein GCM10011490_29300 [Pseudoclavibacter endophyticus]|uniref:DUF2178 domain-containing protein n=1 Tax=Pseudoclavibacter endophyticus TaxID=1778590 RepID=A0A6H9WAD3_9MICO|nr:hypothetical protein [Pseudoclavibacter endophyticus]KAB1646664.1 hypothetical protein F8O04_12985 [Pseudoclavibacter endophyticus]GGA76679.1 hypothetical protein GCM10011490_29300 [Pseudoclavibacter endophyticus]
MSTRNEDGPGDGAEDAVDPHEASAGDAASGRATRSRRRWPISTLNTVLLGVGLVGAVVFFIIDSPFSGAVMLIATVAVAVGALLARRRGSSDLERINALEYADERDRAAAVKGLAAVGVASLVLLVVQIIVAVALGEGVFLAASTLLVLSIVWLIANWYFVRRG